MGLEPMGTKLFIIVDLLEAFSDAERSCTVLLANCMSPLPGFEAQARTFLTEACAAGARLMICEEALAALERNGSIR